MVTVTMTMPENKKLQYQLQWQKNIFFHNDNNDNDEISKPKTSMMVTITRHVLKIGRWLEDDNDEYH